MLIHFVRHTTPNIDTGICYGQSDLSLADSFENEKLSVLAKLKDKYDAVYTSPLQRCAILAQHIATDNLVSDERIMEYNFGDWELRPWNDFKSTTAQNWMNNFVDQPAPNGDSIITMRDRVMSFFNELIHKDHDHVAVVTHSGVQRLIHAHILEASLSHLFRLQLDFGAVMEVTSDLKSELLTIKHL